MNPDWTVRPITLSDLDELVRLHGMYLNYGDGIRAHFGDVLKDPNTVAVQCVHDGHMVGLDIYTRGIQLSGGHPDLCAEIRGLVGDAPVYTGDALLVVPAFRKKGLDAAMLEVCREQMWARGARFVLYELWVHPDGRIPAHHTVERYDHVIDIGLHRNFYVNFDHYGYICSLCGIHCKCSAHLYLCRLP